MEEPITKFNSDNLTTLLICVLLITFFRFLFQKLAAAAAAPKGPKPPTVAGGWPIIGHLPLLGGSELPHIKLGALADKYGPIFSIRLGIHSAVVINSWEAAKQCYTTHDLAISYRPQVIGGKLMGYNRAMFAFAPYGSYWRKMRKIATHELLSNRRLELLTELRASEVKQAITELYHVWNGRNGGQGHGLVDMKQWFDDLTMNMILRVVAGKRFYGAAATVEEEEARRCHKATKDFLRLMGIFILGDAVPCLGWLDVGGHVKAMKWTSKVLDSMLTTWLEEHKKNRASSIACKDEDFMDVMLSVLKETPDVNSHGFNDDTTIKATCLTMILGGSETGAVVLTWALSLLLNNRPALKKVQEELDTHVGRDRELKESDVHKLVYLQAIVKETLRLYGAVGLIVRQALEDITIDHFHIEKGTWMIFNYSKIHRDGNVWEEPLEFKPERFLTTHKDFDVKGQQFEFLPFGGGRRVCPGMSLGLQMSHLILGTLLHAFDVSTPNDAAVDMTGSPGLSNMKAGPLEVLINPRLPHSLYQ